MNPGLNSGSRFRSKRGIYPGGLTLLPYLLKLLPFQEYIPNCPAIATAME